MSRVTITVTTADGGDVEVTETSPRGRAMCETDAAHVDDLLTRATTKVRAAYDIRSTTTVTNGA